MGIYLSLGNTLFNICLLTNIMHKYLFTHKHGTLLIYYRNMIIIVYFCIRKFIIIAEDIFIIIKVERLLHIIIVHVYSW